MGCCGAPQVPDLLPKDRAAPGSPRKRMLDAQARAKEYSMNYLITGGCGFVGSNIAAYLLERGDSVVVFDNLSRLGAAANLAWLRTLGNVNFVYGDARNQNDLAQFFEQNKLDAIFHLAGQVAMTTSMQDPRRDFESNVLGSINLLENVRRRCPEAPVVYSSSNKVYGELAGVRLREEALRYVAPDYPDGLDETIGLDFQTLLDWQPKVR